MTAVARCTDTLDPIRRRRADAPPAEVLRHFRSPTLPQLIPDATNHPEPGVPAAYALLPRLSQPVRPHVFPSLQALARRIHRERAGEALQLRPAQVRFRDRIRDVAEVLAVDEAGGRTRRIGYAWHAGRPAEALRAALEATVPPAEVVE